jgi:hypothetical protein
VPTLLVVLVAVALGVAGLLLQGPGDGLFGDDGGDDPPPDETDAPADETAAISRSVDFDPPPGDGSEHADEAAAGVAFDGDPATSWSSERYNSPEWGGLKEGVGLIFALADTTDLRGIEVASPGSGWEAAVYVADGDVADLDTLDDWDEPVATLDSGNADAAFEAEGNAVLLWFTRTGDNQLVEVTDVRILR